MKNFNFLCHIFHIINDCINFPIYLKGYGHLVDRLFVNRDFRWKDVWSNLIVRTFTYLNVFRVNVSPSYTLVDLISRDLNKYYINWREYERYMNVKWLESNINCWTMNH